MKPAVLGAALVISLGLSGCADEPLARRTSSEVSLFGPSGMRLHPIFTQVKDWTGDGKPDGIEALIEFQDQFEDPTKAAGRGIFELFEYRKDSPDPRGKRLAGPWVGSLQTIDEQNARWNRTSRTYSFQLDYPAIHASQTYVLTGIFELSTGGRFFDRIVLMGKTDQALEMKRDGSHPTTQGAPGSRTPEP